MKFCNQLKIVTFLILSTFISSCAYEANLAQHDAAISAPLATDMARIYFVRRPALLDAIVTHYVFDCGTNIKYDATLIEKSQFQPTQITNEVVGPNLPIFTIIESQKEMTPNSSSGYNAYIALNKQINLDDTMLKSLAFTGNNYDWIVPMNLEEKPNWFITNNNEMGSRLRVYSGGKLVSGVEAIQYLASMISPNAQYIGPVGSGDAIVFDRPPGILRLKVVAMNGTEVFAPSFPLEKGKKYNVVYSIYHNFTINERQ